MPLSKIKIFSVCCAVLLLLTCNSEVLAEQRQASEYDLKSVFILNFARFVDSAVDNNAVYLICYAGDERVRSALSGLRGKKVRNRLVEVRNCRNADEVSQAQLIYISATERRLSKELLAAVRNKPVLTIAEHEGFRGQGGMIQLLIDQDKVGFKVNLRAIKDSGLRVHPQLLKLAHEVEG